MALDGTQLGDEIYQALVNGGYVAEDRGDANAIWQAVGQAIVDHFEANGEVPSGIAVQVDTSTGAGSTQEAGDIT